MQRSQRLLVTATGAALTCMALVLMGGLAAYYYLEPSLPDVETLREVQLQVPLRVYSRDHRLIAQIGEMRRIPVRSEDIPQTLVQAFLAAEDDRFFEHPGVDYQGLLRAGIVLLSTGEISQGGSTITMQLARNFFLTPERKFVRKLREIFLALRIEHELDKQEILRLYLNKIFLGQRAYGVGAAAEVYFGKTLDELTLAEIATIAGLPKAPSDDNPVRSPERATARRAYVLRRMHELNRIDTETLRTALAAPMESRLHGPTVELEAPWVAEMVRQEMVERFGKDDLYTAGYQVTTTLDSRLQADAVNALRLALLEYDRRHGYRGPVAELEWPLPEAVADDVQPEAQRREALNDFADVGGLATGLVFDVGEQDARVFVRGAGEIELGWDGIKWARPYIDDNNVGAAPGKAAEVLAPGHVIRLARSDEGGWVLSQLPAVQGAIVSLDPLDGALLALSGGFDFFDNKFNRAVQARRQPGSSFKPFIYAGALDKGFTTASIVNDAPVVFRDPGLESIYRPQNDTRRWHGPIRLREALVRSINLVSVRLLQDIGIPYAINYLTRFGFAPEDLPHDLSLALGSAGVSPLQLAEGYAVFANGGYKVEPYFIERVEDASGEMLYQADPLIVCAECERFRIERELEAEAEEESDRRELLLAPEPEPAEEPAVAEAPELEALFYERPFAPRTISEQTAYLVSDMLRDVIKRGTGRRALALNRNDVAGKTGTTDDRRDAWFSGFNGRLVATVWVGFDQERPLGRYEEGSRTALPMWIHYMGEALDGTEAARQPPPRGIVTARILPESGMLASANDKNAIFEIFRAGHLPARAPQDRTPGPFGPEGEEEELDEEILF
ncbi:MAG: penicillin-binding protein 1A [Gammaproteobacteria bacterium]|nr:penicillin-binding protein 1A [Gammaproteobacteria bacterium]